MFIWRGWGTIVLEDTMLVGPQIANYVVRTEDAPRVIPGRTISLLFKTMARRTSSACTLQSYQSG